MIEERIMNEFILPIAITCGLITVAVLCIVAFILMKEDE